MKKKKTTGLLPMFNYNVKLPIDNLLLNERKNERKKK